MGYLGYTPPDKIISTSDLEDLSITSSKLSNTPIPVAKGGTGAVTLTGLVKGSGTSALSAAVAGTDYLAPAAIGTTVQAYDADLTSWAGIAPAAKQDALVSGTSIKTVNSTTLLGSGNLAVGDVTLAGVQSLTNKTITDIVYTLTGTTPNFALVNGAVQTWSLSGASTPTDSLTTGQSFILVITPGAYSITWPSVTWTKQGGSGAAPTLYSAGKTTVVLWKVGSTLYGSHLGDSV